MGRLLRRDGSNPGHLATATAFWEKAVAGSPGVALDGFGWMAELMDLDDEVWAQLTLRTLEVTGGSIDWSHSVAQRAASMTPSVTALAVMNALVRGVGDPWRRRENIDFAVQFIKGSGELAETVEYQRLHTSLRERNAM